MNIPLGYELGTGKAISIPLRHLAVVGQTQLSGKTTTLEALISRSGLRAIAFITKRAEGGFAEFRVIPPYFRERADWQFVESVLEATLRERLKFERSWIMRAAQGAHSLKDVASNVDVALEKARGISQSVYTVLAEYLKLVIPQIERLPYSRKIDLQPGVNVMDLRGYSMEMQALVIRSVLEWVYQKEERVITIIPEAWEFIPEERGSPVLNAAEELIRKGGAARNFIWIDSQDLANVNKRILKSVGVYILGVQQEVNEVKRTVAHMYSALRKPKPDDVKALGLGQFYVAYDQVLCRVYVQPAWLWPEAAREVALRQRSAHEYARVAKPPKPIGNSGLGVRGSGGETAIETPEADAPRGEEEGDEMWREKYEAEAKERKRLEKRVEELERDLARISQTAGELQAKLRSEKENPKAKPSPLPSLPPTNPDHEALYQKFRARLLQEPAVLQVLAQKPELEVTMQRQKISLDGGSLQGRVAQLIAEKFFDSPRSLSDSVAELRRRGCNQAPPNVWRVLQKLAEMGFLVREGDKTYQAIPEMKVNIVER